METSLAEEGMAGNTKSGGQEPIYFGSLHGMFGGFRLAPRFVTRQRLEALFQTQGGVILLDTEAQEIMPDPASGGQLYPQLRPGGVYLVTDEQQLEAIDRTDDDRAPLYTPEIMNERLFAMQKARMALIKELYRPRHPHLHTFTEDHLVHGFVKAVKEGPLAIRAFLKKETETGIYSLDVFTTKFCEELVEEVENFENSGLPVMRPNSMNNYGLILDEIGFFTMINEFMVKYLLPISSLLYPDVGGDSLDDHHAFIVQYKMTEDRELDFHYDSSEVTLNVCLGKKFEGGSLFFSGLLHDPTTHKENFEFRHTPGRALLHRGKHRHGANPITSGERYNFILWCKSSAYRARSGSREPCPCGHSHHDV